MHRTNKLWGGWKMGAVLVLGVCVSASARAAQIPGGASAAPTSVLLFPVAVGGGEGGAAAPPAGAEGTPPAAAPAMPNDSVRQAQEIVTDAIRKYLARSGVSVILYDRRLPSIQRAVAEGTLRPDDVSGPGDDPRKAQRLADITGADEYITATLDNYKFDAASRTATFNLSLFRNTTAEGAALGTSAAAGRAVAPADVAAPRQEGSAIARAAEEAANQAVQGLFPRAPAPPATRSPARSGSRDRLLIPLVGAVLGFLVFSR